MISSQRLVILIITINLMAGLCFAIWQFPTNPSNAVGDNSSQQMQDWRDSFQEGMEGGGSVSSTDAYQPTYGNPINTGEVIWNMLGNAVYPFGTEKYARDWIEFQILYWVGWVRFLLNIIAVIEAFFIIFNKKVT